MLRVRDVWKHVRLSLIGDRPSEAIGYPESQFYSDLSNVVADFAARTGIVASISGIETRQGEGVYEIPPDVLDAEQALYDCVYLAECESVTLDALAPVWRFTVGRPQFWAQDSVQPRKILVWPAPQSPGDSIASSAFLGTVGYGTDLFEPVGPFYGVVANISPVAGEMVAALEVLGTFGSLVWGRRNLLVIGVAAPPIIGSMDDVLRGMPESVASYLAFGCLAMLYSSSSELKDPARASYAAARYEEGVQVVRALARTRAPAENL